MNLVFADTSFFVAIVSEHDCHHEMAEQFDGNFPGRYVTATNITAFSQDLGWKAAA